MARRRRLCSLSHLLLAVIALRAGEVRAGEIRAYLGLHLADVTADRAGRLGLDEERGVEVLGVEKDGPADRAGICAGDALLSFNGEQILGGQQLIRLVGETPPGRKVRLEIWRGGKSAPVTITLGAKPVGYLGRIDPPPASDWLNDIPVPFLLWQNNVLGLLCEPVAGDWAKIFGGTKGLLVRAIARDSIAGRSGLRVGDLMISARGQALSEPQDLTAQLRLGRQEHVLRLSVLRSAKLITVTVALGGEAPAQ